jgi:hypothetical protein
MATHRALEAVDNADIDRLYLVLKANPHVQAVPGTGPFLVAILMLAAGQKEEAYALAAQAAADSTDLERKARLINLRRLASAVASTLDLTAGGTRTTEALINASRPRISVMPIRNRFKIKALPGNRFVPTTRPRMASSSPSTDKPAS